MLDIGFWSSAGRVAGFAVLGALPIGLVIAYIILAIKERKQKKGRRRRDDSA